MNKGLFKKFRKDKKGFISSLNLLPTVMVSLGLFVLIGAIVAGIVSDQRDTYTADTYEYNISQDGLVGMDNVSSRTGTIGTTVAAGVLIAIVLGAFGYASTRR